MKIWATMSRAAHFFKKNGPNIMILPSCLRSCLLLYSCACDIHPLREDEYHSERSTSFLERCTSKQWLRYTSLEMKYSSLKMKYSSLSDIHPRWDYEYDMHRSTNSKYSFTGGSSCDICHIGPLGQHLVFDSVLSQRTNMANITLRSSCKRVYNIINLWRLMCLPLVRCGV